MKEQSVFRGIYPMTFAVFDGQEERLVQEGIVAQVKAMIAAGVHGVGVLGLASEVNRLTNYERRQMLEWVCEAVGGRLPVSVTVGESSRSAQVETLRAAAQNGAAWAILQPPSVPGTSEAGLVRFFGWVAERSELPLGIQNAPEHFGYGLSAEGLRTLNRNHPNVYMLKLESAAVTQIQVIDETEGAYRLFSGRGGAELPALIKAGCAGAVTGIESCDVVARIFDLSVRGDKDSVTEAERLAAELGPLLMLIFENMDRFLVYAKRLAGIRLNLGELAPRTPFTPATDFGLNVVTRYAQLYGSLPPGE